MARRAAEHGDIELLVFDMVDADRPTLPIVQQAEVVGGRPAKESSENTGRIDGRWINLAEPWDCDHPTTAIEEIQPAQGLPRLEVRLPARGYSGRFGSACRAHQDQEEENREEQSKHCGAVPAPIKKR